MKGYLPVLAAKELVQKLTKRKKWTHTLSKAKELGFKFAPEDREHDGTNWFYKQDAIIKMCQFLEPEITQIDIETALGIKPEKLSSLEMYKKNYDETE